MASPLASGGVVAARAEPSARDLKRAKELYDNGRALYEEGSYEAAIIAFKQAYELSSDTNLLYNISLAYDRLENFQEALNYLDKYRALAPESERAALERRRRSLKARLEKQKKDNVEPPPPDPDPIPDPDPPPDPDPDEPKPKKPRIFGPAAWGLTATAVVGFGLGTGFGVASLRRSRQGRDDCMDVDGNLVCSESASDDVDRSRINAIVADVSFAVGAAATIALIAVVAAAAVKRKRGESNKRVEAAAAFGRGSAGLVLRGRF